MGSKNNDWYRKIISLLKLEGTTKHGRVNLAGVFVITFFCLAYSASDVIRHFISAAEGVVKSIILQTNIHYEYETAGVFKASIPIIIIIVLCLLYLAWHEKAKKEASKNDDDTLD